MEQKPRDLQDLQYLLTAYRGGEPGALDKLVPLIYQDLRRLARRHVHQWPNLTLETTSVVHEVYLKLSKQRVLDAKDKAHFMAICSQAMRQLMVSYARKRFAEKRGAHIEEVNIDELEIPIQAEAEELLLIDQALRTLAEVDIRLVRVFECRFFAGFTEEETAQTLDVPLRTVQRDWMRARVWIKEMLSPPADD